MSNGPLHPVLAKLYDELTTGARDAPVASFLGVVEDPKWAGDLILHVLNAIRGGNTDRADTSNPEKFKLAILTIMRARGKY